MKPPKGYKQTELGILPDNWEVVKCGEVAEVNKSSLKDNTDPHYTFTYIDLSSVNQGNINIPKKRICFKEAPSRARRIIEMGNIIIATVRPNLQGFAYIDFPCRDYIVSTGFAVLSYKKDICMKYLYNLFYSKIIVQQINAVIAGSNYPAINGLDIKNFIIPLPPLREQEKIAEILNAADLELSSYEKLIALKEKYKKGLMQKLLTPKIRFKEFKEQWKMVKLGEVADFISGYSFSSSDFADTGIALIKISNISDNKVNIDDNTSFLPLKVLKKYEKFIVKNNDLLVAMSGATTGKMGIYKLNDIALLNQRVGIIRAKENNSQIFLAYILGIYANKILEIAYGGAQPNISFNDIHKIKINIPNSLKEQQKIAEVLSSCDAEIQNLKDLCALLKKQKHALMQRLLSGKVRVKGT